MCDEALTVTSKTNIQIQYISCYLPNSLNNAANKCTNVVATLFLIGIILFL